MAFPSFVTRRPPDDPADSGIVLAVYPAIDGSVNYGWFDVEIQRSSAQSSGVNIWQTIDVLPFLTDGRVTQYTDVLPDDGGTRTYRARHIGSGFDNGAWTAEVSAKPIRLAIGPIIPTEMEGARRIDTFRQDDAVLKPAVTQRAGGVTESVMTGQQAGSANGGYISTGTWVDGPTVTFPISYTAAPTVKLYPESGVVFNEPDSAAWSNSTAFTSTLRQYTEMAAVNITTAGFKARARLIQRSTALSGVTRAWTAGAALDKSESTSVQFGSSAPSYNDAYKAWYDVDASLDSVGTFSITAVVAIDTNTTGGFVERGTRSYSTTLASSGNSTHSWSGESKSISIAGVGSTDQIRIRFKSLNVSPGSTSDVTVTVDPTSGVTWSKVGGTPIYAPMCPSTDDTVSWVAVSGETTT